MQTRKQKLWPLTACVLLFVGDPLVVKPRVDGLSVESVLFVPDVVDIWGDSVVTVGKDVVGNVVFADVTFC